MPKQKPAKSQKPAKPEQSRTDELAERAKTLDQQRKRKMARDAHAYVRGSTVKFYEWLDCAAANLPQGPPVWICGDCHVGNLGPVASADGRVEIEIRDLDQTVVGNPAHDIVRLALSLAMAARSSDLPGVTTARMLEHLMEGYGAALRKPSAPVAEDAPNTDIEPIRAVLASSMRRRWKHLAIERIEDEEPTIPLGRNFLRLHEEERAGLKALVKTPAVRKLITQLKERDDNAQVKLVDAAYWIKGCSSLGKLRFALLLGVGRKKERRYCLVDVKEAVAAAAPAAQTAAAGSPTQPADFAERVVLGARALSPFLGNRMMSATLLRRPVVVRELLPQDLKLEMQSLTCEQAVGIARYFAAVVGRAHARQMNAATRKRWLAELSQHRSKSLDAPGWLWRSVVELVGVHEAAYLEHCRRYAMQPE